MNLNKTKLVKRLIEVGVNKNEAKDMVDKKFDYVERVYPMATINKKAEIIHTLQ